MRKLPREPPAALMGMAATVGGLVVLSWTPLKRITVVHVTVPGMAGSEDRGSGMPSSKDRLAQALVAVGADELAARARRGHYDDIEAELPYPKIVLAEDLTQVAAHPDCTLRRRRAIKDLILQVQAGDYDNTSDEWAKLL